MCGNVTGTDIENSDRERTRVGMNVKIKSTVSLFITAIIWGSAFVAQKWGMDSISPLFFSAFRMLLGSAALVIMVAVANAMNGRKKRGADASAGEETRAAAEVCVKASGGVSSAEDGVENGAEDGAEDRAAEDEKKTLRKGGLICGIVIFFAFNLQQFGLVSVDAGKTGFITALYIIIVPFMSIFLRHKTTLFNWLGAIVGVVGLYFLCITENLTIMRGDIIVMIGSFFWAAHIICIDHFAPKVNVLKLNAYQFFVAGIISLAAAIFTEELALGALMEAAPAIIYTAIFSTAIAYSFQAYGQKAISPTVASIILSTEALFAVIFGGIFLHESLTYREAVGCALMFAAVILAQIPPIKRKGDLDVQ